MPDGTDKTPIEINHVNTRSVSCDGGIGAYGHPKVYLRVTGREVGCPYCSRLFVLRPDAGGEGAR